VFERVLALVTEELRELYGASGFYQWSESIFMRVEGESVVFVVVTPFEHDAVVNVRCYVAREVDRVDPELGAYLCRVNAGQLFGGFSLDEDGDVCFDHSLLGSSVNRETLHLAIQVVAQAAERFAPEVIGRWGGVSSLEMLQQQAEEREEPGGGDETLN